MAKVVIEFEDKEDGKVRVEALPNFETMMMKQESGETLTSAQAYAVCALNKVREEAKNQDPTRIIIPKVKL